MIEITPTNFIKKNAIKWLEFDSPHSCQLDMNNLYVTIGLTGGGQTEAIRITEEKMHELKALE